MKKILKKVFLFIAALISIYAPAQDNKMESVEYVSQPSPGIMQVRSTGYGKNAEICVEEAQRNAFKSLIFRGIAGSPVSGPIISGDITGAEMDKKTQAFFNESVYKKFITHIVQFSKKERTKFGKRVVVDMNIDYKSLIAYFEQTGAVRKFGY
jgi:hypothetical protein